MTNYRRQAIADLMAAANDDSRSPVMRAAARNLMLKLAIDLPAKQAERVHVADDAAVKRGG